MNALLIALSALSVGKIHGQDTIASFVINSQVAAVSPNRRPTVLQEISKELQPPPPPQQPSFQDRDRSEPVDRGDFSLPPHPIIPENEPRIIIISVTQPTRMELPPNKTNVNSRANTTSNSVRNNTRQKDVAEKMSTPKQVQPVRPKNEMTKDNELLPEKPTVVGPISTTNVTFDERANFDGDQCPTGYVRVNGKCIESD